MRWHANECSSQIYLSFSKLVAKQYKKNEAKEKGNTKYSETPT
jgi:hypothetical protein